MENNVFEFEENDTGLTLKKFLSGGSVVDIPADRGGIPVTRIGAECFKENGLMVSEIIVPDTVTVLEHDSFAYCVSLEKLILPESIEYIGADYLIASGLLEAYIPAGVIEIDRPELIDRRFVVSEKNLFFTTDGFGLYKKDNDIKTLVAVNASDERSDYDVAEGTKAIAVKALQDISTLKTIKIPASVEHIPETSFSYTGGKASGSTGIENIIVSGDNDKFYIHCDCLCERMSDDNIKVLRYTGGEACTLDEDITELGAECFKNTSLKEIRMSPKLNQIGDGAFSGCLLSYAYIGDKEIFFGEEDQFTTEKLVLQFGSNSKVYDTSVLDSFLINDYLTEPRIRMICSRLLSGYKLSDKNRRLLEQRLTDDPAEVIRFLAETHNARTLDDMGRLNLFSEAVTDKMTELTGSLGEKEMTAWFMTYKKNRFGFRDELDFL